MKQELGHTFDVDKSGNPAGGFSSAVGLTVVWQKGPLGRGEERKEPNGAFVETLIQCAYDRLSWYQGSRFSCQENADAMAYLSHALAALEARTAKREARGAEGTHEV